MRKLELSIPKRQLHWKKYSYLRNKQENVYYLCQCGKKYVSFPAIYLHFERKHDQKISNLHNPAEYNAIMTASETTYLFFIKKRNQRPAASKNNNRKRNPILELRIKKALTVVDQFLADQKPQLEAIAGSQFVENIFTKFSHYLYEILRRSQSEITSVQDILRQLPNHFNDFLLSSHAKVKVQQKMKDAQDVFMLFSKWLNSKKYSELIVILNNEEGPVMIDQN